MYYHDFKNDEFADKYIFKGKANGYFVEVGACSGIDFSQCYYFEKNLNWNGIAVEPQIRFRETILTNRKNACCKCIGNKNEMLTFAESNTEGLSGVKNILLQHELIESHKTGWRDSGYHEYSVECITLLDLLEEYNAPLQIDYLGMDCEGSEYTILEHYFNHNKKYLITLMCLEVGRSDIIDLMIKNDYIEVTNPLLPLYQNNKVTWERYFIHKSKVDSIDSSLVTHYN